MKYLIILFFTFNAYAVFNPITTTPPSTYNLPINQKGSLITSDGTLNGELLVGTVGQFLTVNPTAPNGVGLEWVTATLLDTNASTICSNGEYLDGDGTCKIPFSGPSYSKGAAFNYTAGDTSSQTLSVSHNYTGAKGINIYLEDSQATTTQGFGSSIDLLSNSTSGFNTAVDSGLTSVARMAGAIKGGIRNWSWVTYRPSGVSAIFKYSIPCESVGKFFLDHASVATGISTFDIILGTSNGAYQNINVNNCRIVVEQL